MKTIYGVLCILGLILPYSQFIPWLLDNGLDLSLLIQQALSLRIGAFAWLDVIISAIALIIFIIMEGRKLFMKHLWLPIVGTCTVGVSLGLPLFLLLRELHQEKQNKF